MIVFGGRGLLSGAPVISQSRVLQGPYGGDTGSILTAAGTTYAWYAGTWGAPLTSVDVGYYVHSAAAAGAGWAELGIATGPIASQGTTTSLTARGFVSIDTEVKAGTTTVRTATISGLTIGAGVGLWILVGNSYATTQASFRCVLAGDRDVMGYACARADAASTTTRPSLNIGTARDFTGTPGTGFPLPLTWAVIPG